MELPETVLTVAGDEERLRSALENLCYNALSFTPEDGAVALSLRREDRWAVIDVTDTGAGIDPADLPRVFDRGFTHRPDGSGQGMGLFIVRIADLEHGGAAEVRSRVGGGSVFTLRLPLFEQ